MARLGSSRQQTYLDALVSHEVPTGASVGSPAPIAPEQWGRTHLERMQQQADLARLCRGVAIPLALLTQWARTTTPNAGSIHDASASIGFSTVLMRGQFLISRTTQRPIGLEYKILA